jgi:hypothetical protein
MSKPQSIGNIRWSSMQGAIVCAGIVQRATDAIEKRMRQTCKQFTCMQWNNNRRKYIKQTLTKYQDKQYNEALSIVNSSATRFDPFLICEVINSLDEAIVCWSFHQEIT